MCCSQVDHHGAAVHLQELQPHSAQTGNGCVLPGKNPGPRDSLLDQEKPAQEDCRTMQEGLHLSPLRRPQRRRQKVRLAQDQPREVPEPEEDERGGAKKVGRVRRRGREQQGASVDAGQRTHPHSQPARSSQPV